MQSTTNFQEAECYSCTSKYIGCCCTVEAEEETVYKLGMKQVKTPELRSARTSSVVVVCQEGCKCHSLGRSEGVRLPGRHENNREVAQKWLC